MSARTRIVSSTIALVAWGIVGARAANADSLAGSMSAANMATGLPSWTIEARYRAKTLAHTNTIIPNTPPAAHSTNTTPTFHPAVALSPSHAPATVYNAFVNLGTGPYPEASLITNGNAQPWYDSTAIAGFFGGHAPNAQQQAGFDGTVIQRIEQTFRDSGVAIALTANPSDTASHTLSLVSNTAAQLLPSAIGMTDVGANGFSFIDQEAKSAGSPDQLESIVAHNISHELMLTMGVGENYDTTGNYVDARNANLSMMISPNATFSQGAVTALNQAISAADAAHSSRSSSVTAAQVIEVVPEPGSLVVWGLLALAAALRVRARG